ncbi:MAG: hypothetical protein NW201_03925, partial [Gemmatimonadales bacterium]|nr:hypothetical protein [Gemmatimonadales bacterium]
SATALAAPGAGPGAALGGGAAAGALPAPDGLVIPDLAEPPSASKLLRTKVQESATSSPDVAAQVVKTWLMES